MGKVQPGLGGFASYLTAEGLKKRLFSVQFCLISLTFALPWENLPGHLFN
jgi:hypothetical protein